jgi:single-stranded DNA-specific DHH superfamily exonuclease
MLTEKQVSEIKEHLEKSQNPLFFFDNDNDGLTSFLQLQRYLGRGRGVAIKSFPELNASYYRKIQELKPDYVFILDKPVVSKEFLEKVKQDNIPIVWIDHHQVETPDDREVHYYNPYHVNKTSEPISYLSYRITNKKEDIWLAIVGCISDHYLPDFYREFQKKYPELGKENPSSPFEVFFESGIGEIARILDFSLKDTTTNVVNMLRFMTKVKEPTEILEENSKTKNILNRYREVDSKYQKLMEKARKFSKNKFIYFQYGGPLSLSSNIANQLSYEFKNKIIVVVYIRGDVANISLRGKNILELTLKAIEDIEGAIGGGHKDATGAKLSVSYLPKFRDNVEKLVHKINAK